MTIPQTPEGAGLDPKNLSPRDVQDLHRNADSDVNWFALHHTLGLNQNQASPGGHTHEGKDSKALTKYVRNDAPLVVSGSRGGNLALASLLGQLAAKGIITDATTA